MANSVTTLRPDGTTSSSGVTVTGGGGTVHGALSDSSDASYVDITGGAGGNAQVTLGTFTLPRNAYPVGVQARVRVAYTPGGASPNGIFVSDPPSGVTHLPDHTAVSGATPVTLTGSLIPYQNATNKTLWVQSLIDAMQMYFMQGSVITYVPTLRFYELYLDVVYNQAPVASLITPNAATPLQAPVIGWTYTDPENDGQNKAQVKVFTAAQVAALGFDPETSTPTWSGTVSGATPSIPVGVVLADGLYTAYVKVADTFQIPVGGIDANGNTVFPFAPDHWGDWASQTFTVVSEPPAVPVISSVTPDPVLNRVAIVLQGIDNEMTYQQSTIESSVVGWEPNVNIATTMAVADGVTTNASPTITSATANFSQADVGITVTGSGIPGATTIAAVTNATTATLSANATLTASGVTLTFGRTYPRRQTTTFLTGIAAGVMRSAASGTMEIRTADASSLALLQRSAFRVKGSLAYAGNVSLRHATTTGRSGQFVIDWYDATGALLSTASGPPTPITNAAWMQVAAQGAAPPTAVYARCRIVVTGAAAANEEVYFDKADFGPGTLNLLTPNQASLETDTTGWQVGSNCTIARSTAQSLVGAASLALTSVGAGDMNATTSLNVSGRPVVGGRSYTAQAFFRAATVGRGTIIYIYFYDAAGAGVAVAVNYNIGGTTTTTGWTSNQVTVVAPANAAFASVMVYISGAAGAGEVHYVDAILLVETASLTWTRGGFVQVPGAALDTFTRADNAASMGSSEGNGTPAWANGLGTWGIQGNKAYCAAPAAGSGQYNEAYLTLPPMADGSITADVTLSGTRAGAGVIVRRRSQIVAGSPLMWGSVMILLIRYGGVGGADAVLFIAPDGQNTQVANFGLVNGATYGIKIEFIGATIKAYIDKKLGQGYVLFSTITMSAAAVAAVSTKDSTGFGFALLTDPTNYDDGGSRFDNLVVSGNTSQTVTVERSTDGGATWSTVRTMSKADLTDPGQQATLYDYEAPRGVAIEYRAKVQFTELGSVFTSATSTPVVMSPNLTNDGKTWLKSPTDPTKNVAVNLLKDSVTSKSEEDLAVYAPMGRADYLIHGGTIRTETFDGLEFLCLNDAAWQALEVLRRRQEVLLLQTCYGDTTLEEFWVRFGPDRTVSRLTMTTSPGQIRRVRIPARQVIVPAVP